ncbi:kinase-like protein [Dissoconium aciculare CBS 342.82]|uniref:non-specific serine/threonine protein kinase n=1 Tax=Dissoconium aciculare CBS 342.82 TaxID=1314786 RepID=A0A6J3LV56_9PEZI|nr:kinase-like protein [Dissoconium aciculare CBS 342.82]KAF1819651.1 kinase-like protein [Dissoconium aciculare CBS 342.82]
MEYHPPVGMEPLDDYRPGGYHPVKPDDLLSNGRYRIVHKLGYGGYSVIWLARDQRLDRYVALKIAKSLQNEHLYREVAALQVLSADNPVPKALDQFSVGGKNGTHACYTMPVAAGNLANAKYDDVFPVQVARAFSAKFTLTIASFHARGYCHEDLRLQNIPAKLDVNIDDLDVDQFRQTVGSPKLSPVERLDDKTPSEHVPREVCPPLRFLGKTADEFTLEDAKNIIVADFGQAWQPDKNPLRLHISRGHRDDGLYALRTHEFHTCVARVLS